MHDPHTYDVVTRDLLQRWAFPLVPDANLLPGCNYRCTAHCVYEEGGVSLARSATVVRDSVVGAGTSIGEKTTVDSSVLGRISPPRSPLISLDLPDLVRDRPRVLPRSPTLSCALPPRCSAAAAPLARAPR